MTARPRMILVVAGAVLVALGAFGARGPVAEAGAAILPTNYSGGLLSAQLDGPALYWFERTPATNTKGSGRVLRRDLTLDGETKVIFSSADGFEIAGFRAAYGRVAIAQANGTTGESRVLELKQQGDAWPTTPLITRNANPAGDSCWARARLITINPAAEIVTEDLRIAGRGGQCTIQRPLSTLFAVAADGTSRTLLDRKGAWSTSADTDSLGRLTHGFGDWLISHEPGSVTDGRTGLLNIASGEYTELIDAPSEYPRPEISAQGQLLVNGQHAAGTFAKLFTDPRNLAAQVVLARRNRTSWFHLCGEKILEISRRGTTNYMYAPPSPPRRSGKRPAYSNGSRWNLWILNMQGQRERRLPQRLRRGTGFEACDAGQAVFHRYLRKGAARQFSVPLG